MSVRHDNFYVKGVILNCYKLGSLSIDTMRKTSTTLRVCLSAIDCRFSLLVGLAPKFDFAENFLVCQDLPFEILWKSSVSINIKLRDKMA